VKACIVHDRVIGPSHPVTFYTGVQGNGVYKTITGSAGGDSAWTKLLGLPNGGFTQMGIQVRHPGPQSGNPGIKQREFI